MYTHINTRTQARTNARTHAIILAHVYDFLGANTANMDGEKAWRTAGTVQQQCNTPRSYLMERDQGAVLRRNRKHLKAKAESPAQMATTTSNVLAYPETEAPVDDTTPMVLTPPLLHTEKTFVEDVSRQNAASALFTCFENSQPSHQ